MLTRQIAHVLRGAWATSLAAVCVAAVALSARAAPGSPGGDLPRQQASPIEAPASRGEPSDPAAQGAGVSPDSGAVSRGLILYASYCMNCHGGDGRGGRDGGSDLRESEMLKANDGGKEFAAFLPVGRPEQRMPATPLPEKEIADLWAFLQVLVPSEEAIGAAAAAPITGDARDGERHFSKAGCAGCHAVTADLAGLGARLDVQTIHQRLLRPVRGADAATPADAPGELALQRHTQSVKKLSAQAVRDLAVYLGTLK